MQNANPSHLRACFVSTYPPRQCGIATFTSDLCQALCQGQGRTLPSVLALTHTPNEYQYPPEVFFEIHRTGSVIIGWRPSILIYTSVDIICLQHEFGIFGGQEG